ncbi:RNA binding domain-containing protein [Eremomyces bilateralis CBS 781.70]|uniref:RNA binding domain-containing protein n=1 Tax=Eremomyces bilateralis CBS 781.70 TaxID=1392243 RepID=A0A6G1G722_9PEZI|nr:RNA binding domain-containing protein [Eremomyces bilateralis CBS 781.70]KAF1813629.1 RNA binding domain-containing protein [Eremomyces bilateralis CBS 781.70]
MHFLRRAAFRVVSTSTRQVNLSAPRNIRPITTVNATVPRTRLSIATSLIQRRFASDEAVKTDEEKLAEKATSDALAAETSTLTPAEQAETVVAEQPTSDALGDVEGRATIAASAVGQERAPRSNAPKHTLYIGNLNFEVTDDQLSTMFSEFGTLNQCTIVKDHRGLPRGFAFVSFETKEAADAAIEAMNEKIVAGRIMIVHHRTGTSSSQPRQRREHTTPRPEFPPSRTLYIGNMSWQMTDKDLTELFRGIRNVLDVRVAIDRATGHPRGFAHADFVDTESATSAKAVLDNKLVYDRTLRVNYAETSARAKTAPAAQDEQNTLA